jgi:hypothetical protein
MGDGRWEIGDGRSEIGDGRSERRIEIGDRRSERRIETSFPLPLSLRPLRLKKYYSDSTSKFGND